MTYRELFYKATRLIDNGKITLGEYEEMTKPLDREVEQEPITKNDLRVEKIEVRKPCINYEDGCEEWAGCPCVYYKARK